jgi:hypothetical protein
MPIDQKDLKIMWNFLVYLCLNLLFYRLSNAEDTCWYKMKTSEIKLMTGPERRQAFMEYDRCNANYIRMFTK